MNNLTTYINRMFEDPFAISKTTIGFDDLFGRMYDYQTRFAKTMADSFPPFNIRKENENKYVIEMAVAGFSKNDLSIEMQDGILRITGQTQSTTEDEQPEYLYKGIAGRTFTRSFNLADTVEIKDAELVNGVLKVYLENLLPLAKLPKKVEIKDANNGSANDVQAKAA